MDLNDLVSSYLESHEYDNGLVLTSSIMPGFGENGAVVIDGLYLHQYLDKAINQISKKIETLTNQLSVADPALRLSVPKQAEIRKQIEGLNEQLNTLADVAESSAKNHIIDLFSKNMLDFKNRQDLLTPISFKAVKGLRSETLAELGKLLSNEEFINDLQKAGLIQLVC